MKYRRGAAYIAMATIFTSALGQPYRQVPPTIRHQQGLNDLLRAPSANHVRNCAIEVVADGGQGLVQNDAG